MSLKTKQMLKIFQPIEDQVKKLSGLLNNNAERSEEMVGVKKLILDQLYSLTEKLEYASKENVESYRDMKKKITCIIEEFCTIDFDKRDSKIPEGLSQEIFDDLLDKFSNLLETLEKSEILPLKEILQECFDYVKEMSAACEIEDLQNIKELGTSIIHALHPLQIYRKNLISSFLSERLALFCTQLCTSFKMLVEVVKEQHLLKLPIYTCKKYICDRLCLCLESIIKILDSTEQSYVDECFEPENNVVFRIDLVLDMILSLSKKELKEQVQDCENLWLGIEDVFTHAMSIAQVCQPYDFKAISGTCQTVLTEYESLKRQLCAFPPDPSTNNLFINTLTDSLYRLERKINISVLTLVMEVLSDPFSALKKLIQICGTSLTVNDRKKNDLNSVIEEFDQVSDKIMQIGKFAMACCRDKNRVGKIKNCLASFESLEMELIPAVTAFYLHPDNKEMRSCVKLLTAQWQQEMNHFHHTIDLIIDPAAYCEIVMDDLQEKVNEMINICLEKKQDITQSQVQIVIQRALSLFGQITATVNDVGQENVDKQTQQTIRELKAAIYETDAASKKLLTNKATDLEQLRVLNRAEIILKVIKRLLPVLSNIVNSAISLHTIYNKSLNAKGNSNSILSFPSNVQDLSFDQKSSVYIRTPYSVKTCRQPLSIQPANSVPRSESDMSVLIPYIQKGRSMRTEWSLMYKTPKKCEPEKTVKNQLKIKNLSSVRQHLFSRDSFLENSEIDIASETLDLTNILEKLTGLSDTLSTTVNKSVVPQKSHVSFSLQRVKNYNQAQINKITKKLGDCSTSGGGGDAPASSSNSDRPRNSRKRGNKMNVFMKL